MFQIGIKIKKSTRKPFPIIILCCETCTVLYFFIRNEKTFKNSCITEEYRSVMYMIVFYSIKVEAIGGLLLTFL